MTTNLILLKLCDQSDCFETEDKSKGVLNSDGNSIFDDGQERRRFFRS